VKEIEKLIGAEAFVVLDALLVVRLANNRRGTYVDFLDGTLIARLLDEWPLGKKEFLMASFDGTTIYANVIGQGRGQPVWERNKGWL
jgi:hypothetical protein